MEKTILYFEKAGPENTDKLLSVAKERIKELGIRDVVVATTHSGTAIKAQEALGTDLNLVAVTISEGFKDKGWAITPSERKSLEDRGIKVLTSTHALGGDVSSAFTDKYGGDYPARSVRDTLYRFGQGMKVAFEIVLMAADAGLIGMEGEVMAIAGTGPTHASWRSPPTRGSSSSWRSVRSWRSPGYPNDSRGRVKRGALPSGAIDVVLVGLLDEEVCQQQGRDDEDELEEEWNLVADVVVQPSP